MYYCKKILILHPLNMSNSSGVNNAGGIVKLTYSDGVSSCELRLSNTHLISQNKLALTISNGSSVETYSLLSQVEQKLNIRNFNGDLTIDCVVCDVTERVVPMLFATTKSSNEINYHLLHSLSQPLDSTEVMDEKSSSIDTKPTEIKLPQETTKVNMSVIDRLNANTTKVALSEDEVGNYEEFVAVTDNYYLKEEPITATDIKQFKRQNANKFNIVKEYGNAFEQYYATARNENYYQTVKEKLQNIFDNYVPFTPLINAIEDSYWVKIDYPSSSRYFLLGVLSGNGQANAIAYALPADEQSKMLDTDFLYEKYYVGGQQRGYYILYQDAVTGGVKR